MKYNIAVMAGGQSRRFKTDKTLEIFDGKPLICHPVERLGDLADEMIIVAKDCGKYDFTGVKCIEDAYDVQCPMVGILTAVKYFGGPVFVVAADVPFPEKHHAEKLLEALSAADAALPEIDGDMHPLYACYGPGVIPVFENAVKQEDFALKKALRNVKTVYLDKNSLFRSENEKKSFININTREDYDLAKKYTGVSDG